MVRIHSRDCLSVDPRTSGARGRFSAEQGRMKDATVFRTKNCLVPCHQKQHQQQLQRVLSRPPQLASSVGLSPRDDGGDGNGLEVEFVIDLAMGMPGGCRAKPNRAGQPMANQDWGITGAGNPYLLVALLWLDEVWWNLRRVRRAIVVEERPDTCTSDRIVISTRDRQHRRNMFAKTLVLSKDSL